MSSRHEIPSKQPGHRVIVGWDNPMKTFFAQVERVQQSPLDTSDPIVLWLGDTRHQLQRAETLERDLAPYADLTPSILQQLRQDRAADFDRPGAGRHWIRNGPAEPPTLAPGQEAPYHADDFAVWPDGGWATLRAVRNGGISHRSEDYKLVRRQDHSRMLEEPGVAAELDTRSPEQTPQDLKQQSIAAATTTKYEIVYQSGETDRVMRPTGHPLAVIEARDAEEATRVYRANHPSMVAEYEIMAVPAQNTPVPLARPERTMSDNTQRDAPPTPAVATPKEATAATPHRDGKTAPGLDAPTADTPKNDPIDPRQAALHEAIDKLRLALPALENADQSLAQHVDSIVKQASDPVRLNQRLFQHEIAYVAEDTAKVLGSGKLGFSRETTAVISKMAGSAPNLENEQAKALLQSTHEIDDRNLVRNIRRAAVEIGQQADQNTPVIRSRLDTLEDHTRLAPRVETVADTAPASMQARTAQAEAHVAHTAETQQRQDQGMRQPQNSGSFLPGVSTNAVQDGVFRALRSRGPFNTPPWEAGAQPFAERLTAFEAWLKQGKEDIIMRGAERSGRAAMEAMEGFRTGEGAVIMNRIREAARTDPNGMAGVLSEMKDGGKFADLRQQFNNTMADEKGVTAAYDEAASALARYGEDRKAVEQVIARRPDAANLSAKFEAMDKEIGRAAGELPSRRDGKTMLEDLSKQVADMLQKAVNNIKNLFHRSPSASASPSSASPP